MTRNSISKGLALALAGVAVIACKQQGGQRGGSENAQAAQQQVSGSPSAQPRHAQQQASAGASAQQTASGQIVRASSDEIVLRQGGGQPDLRLKVSSDVPVLIDGQQRSLSDLREGTQVRAAYDASKGAPTATRIEATSGSPGSSGAQGTGSSQPGGSSQESGAPGSSSPGGAATQGER